MSIFQILKKKIILKKAEEELKCSFNGFGAFCQQWNYFKSDKFPKNDPEFCKDIVKILDHTHIYSPNKKINKLLYSYKSIKIYKLLKRKCSVLLLFYSISF